ncbi:hypothetical protein Tco_0452018 [Tanacetum coccineum]
MDFMSSPSSTNKVNTAYRVSTANTQVSPASTQVSTASTQGSTANLSDATVYAFLASQPNGSQLVHEDLVQIHEDDLEEMDLKWQFALLSMRTRRGPRNQDSRNMNQDSSRRTVNVEETYSKAMVAIDGDGFDWSYMADDEVPTNMALMTLSDTEIPNKSRKGVGFVSYNVVPPPYTGLFLPPKLDLSNSGLEVFQQPEFEGYGPKTSKSVSEDISNEVRESPDAPLVEELVSDDKPKAVNTARPNSAVVNVVKANQGHPQKEDQGYFDSRCSRHMTGNISYLSDFKEFNGGYVTFGGGAKGGKITGKGTLKTGKFDGKSNDGFFVGYSLNSKAFIVYNIRTMKVEENLHVRFLEDKSIIAGDGPKWLFDIDVLTKSMNYVLVVAGTNSNDFVDGSLFDSSSKDASNDEPQPSNDAEKKDDKGELMIKK